MCLWRHYDGYIHYIGVNIVLLVMDISTNIGCDVHVLSAVQVSKSLWVVLGQAEHGSDLHYDHQLQ